MTRGIERSRPGRTRLQPLEESLVAGAVTVEPAPAEKAAPPAPTEQPAPPPESGQPARGTTGRRAARKRIVRERQIRITVDLDKPEHRKLRDWCSKTGDRTGLTQVSAAETVRLLLGQLYEDKDLEERIIDGLLEGQ